MSGRWSGSDDALLRQMVAAHGQNWISVATHFPTRTPAQIAARWFKCLNPELSKGRFTAEEDAQIQQHVATNGAKNWKPITKILPNRSSKQCRERWENHLNPSLNLCPWTPEEDNFVYRQFKALGPRWAMIAKFLRGRTDVSVKNRFNASIRQRIQKNEAGQEYLQPLTPKLPAKPRPTTASREKRPVTPAVPFAGPLDTGSVGPVVPGLRNSAETDSVIGLFSPFAPPADDPFN
jgi:hypothetical protein